jgi:hypothetical protein
MGSDNESMLMSVWYMQYDQCYLMAAYVLNSVPGDCAVFWGHIMRDLLVDLADRFY